TPAPSSACRASAQSDSVPWRSSSSLKTRRPCWKAATAIEAAVVLLPLPPFCVTNETTLMPSPSHSGVMASWLTRTPLPPEAANGGLTVPVDLPEGGWPPCPKTSKRDPPEPAPPQPTIHRRTTNHRGLRAFASAIWGQPVGDRRQVRLRPFGLVALGSEAWP